MSIFELLTGLGLFVTMVIFQIMIWWFYRIERVLLAMLVLFFCIPLVGFCVLVVLEVASGLDLFSSLLIHLLLSSAYIQTYPVFQEDIPSFKIVLLLRENVSNGVSKQIIVETLARDELFSAKLQDLVDDGLVSRVGHELTLTKTGNLLSLLFTRYRSWLGLESGHG